MVSFSLSRTHLFYALVAWSQFLPFCHTFGYHSRTLSGTPSLHKTLASSTVFATNNGNMIYRGNQVKKIALLATSPTSESIGAFSTQAVPLKVQLILVVSSVIALAIYHINLIIKEKSSEEKTWRQYQADTREDWARHVRSTEGWLYAIQTLRNAITAQTFLATTVLSLLTLITGKLWDVIRKLAYGLERRTLTLQLITVALTMLSSAYYFLQGVRLMTHAGFMFPVSEGTKVDNIMRKTQNCQWLGLRWMYISLGPISWAVGGSRALFVTCFVLLQFFRQIDRKPKGMGYEGFQGDGI